MKFTGRESIRRLIFILLCVTGTAGALWAAFENLNKPLPELAAMLPQGALLTIESNDFGAVLKRWNDSKEKTAWLKSDNFSVFSNSRLFGRLGGAQDEFAQAAGLPPDMNFLSEVAGTRSIFAWYDIGNLEFVYITHLPAGTAEKTRLMQMRGKFATRQAGGQTFYVRTQGEQGGGQPRTVAFAASGDWLLLSTREDLMAGALSLMESASDPAKAMNSLAGENWFSDAHAAAAHEPGAMRMTLNLEKIVPSPYFRSYWVQRNITEMKQYRSAVCDLYLEANRFREERVLLPRSSQTEDASLASGTTQPHLEALTALLPEHAGVYRAVATASSEKAATNLNDTLLARGTTGYRYGGVAPDANISIQPAGSTTDFETRIDLSDPAALVHLPKGSELSPLRQVLEDSGLRAMMTVSRTADAEVWVPFQSAVVFSGSKDWDAAAMQSALQNALQARLTAGGLGLNWRLVHSTQGDYAEISSVRPLEVAVMGKLCIVANDPGLLMEMQARAQAKADLGSASAPAATMLAGFQLQPERRSFALWSAVVDHAASDTQSTDGASVEPAFFSKNIRSLENVFSSLESEQFVERKDGTLTRQTAIYRWRP